MINQQLLCFKSLTVDIPLETVSQHTETAWRILVCMITSILLQKRFPHNLNVQKIVHFLKLNVAIMADTRSDALNLL